MFFDNFFSSVSLLADLEKEGIYSCGTARKDRRGFPIALKKPLLPNRCVTMGLCIHVTLDNTHLYMHTHVHSHAHIQTYTHTHMYTYIHAHSYSGISRGAWAIVNNEHPIMGMTAWG